MGTLRLCVALVVGVAAAAAVGAQDERTTAERIAEFKRFYARRNVNVRRAAVQDFKGTDGLEAAKLLVACFRDPDAEVRALAQEALALLRDPKAVDWLLRRARLSNDAALKARLALAFGHMRHPGILPVLRGLLRHRDPWVRRNAARALGEQRAKEAVPDLLRVLEDEKEDGVRQAVYEALGRIGDPRASPALERALGVGHWSARVAAIEALTRLRTKSGVAALIRQMQKETGRLRTDIRKALEELTGELRFREDARRWQEWWDRYGDRFRVPSKALLEELRRKQARAAAAYGLAPRRYHTIETWSQNIVFCIDISSSMGDKVVVPVGKEEAFRQRYGSRVKLEIVKRELINLLARLEPNVNFRIITFATRVRPWSKDLWRATATLKARAIKKVDSLQPLGRGGSSRGAGRGGGSLAAGRTNTYGALMAALEIPRTGRDREGRLVRTKADTVFFVSDGMPTAGEITDPAEILAQVRRFNATRKIVIHTIGFDKANRAFMMDLARQNGGRYVLIGAEDR